MTTQPYVTRWKVSYEVFETTHYGYGGSRQSGRKRFLTYYETKEKAKEALPSLKAIDGTLEGPTKELVPICFLCAIPQRDETTGEPLPNSTKETLLPDPDERKEYCGLFYCKGCYNSIGRKTEPMLAKVSFQKFHRAWKASPVSQKNIKSKSKSKSKSRRKS